MKKQRSIFFLGIISFLVACDPIIDIEIPPHNSRLVVSSLISTEDVIRIEVSRSVGILGNSDVLARNVGDAYVEVWEDGQLMTGIIAKSNCLENQSDSIPSPCFQSDFLPKPGSSYQIVVSHDSLGVVSAETTVPTEPEIKNVIFIPRVSAGNEGETGLIQFTLVDPPGQNFYEIFAIAEISVEGQPTDQTNIFPLGAISPEQFELDYTQAQGLLEDELFDGQEHTVSLYISVFGGTRNGEPKPTELKKLRFIVRSCDNAYYQYRKTVDLHKQIENYENPVFLLEPISVFSNIENGFGIWASYASFRDTLL